MGKQLTSWLQPLPVKKIHEEGQFMEHSFCKVYDTLIFIGTGFV
jgi:hypothetical protein